MAGIVLEDSDELMFIQEIVEYIWDIRETAKESCGLVNVLKNLLSKEDKIDLNDIDRGAFVIKECLVHKKFLLLDEVDDLNQLKAILDSRDWIPPGSKVSIITTANEHLLNPHGACAMYESKRLYNHEALQLFSLQGVHEAIQADS